MEKKRRKRRTPLEILDNDFFEESETLLKTAKDETIREELEDLHAEVFFSLLEESHR